MTEVNTITNLIISNQNKNIKSILGKISNDYDIDMNELCNKYLTNTVINTIVSKLSSSERCFAKKQDGLRCTRRHQETSEYCGKHINNLKYGRFDTENNQNNDNDFIRTKKEKINGVDYLIDMYERVYSLNADKVSGKHKVIGKYTKVTDESIGENQYRLELY